MMEKRCFGKNIKVSKKIKLKKTNKGDRNKLQE